MLELTRIGFPGRRAKRKLGECLLVAATMLFLPSGAFGLQGAFHHADRIWTHPTGAFAFCGNIQSRRHRPRTSYHRKQCGVQPLRQRYLCLGLQLCPCSSCFQRALHVAGVFQPLYPRSIYVYHLVDGKKSKLKQVAQESLVHISLFSIGKSPPFARWSKEQIPILCTPVAGVRDCSTAKEAVDYSKQPLARPKVLASL